MEFKAFSSRVESPSTRTSPSVGSRRPFRCFASVLFPEPLWPTMAIISPEFISSDTFLRAYAPASSYLKLILSMQIIF